MQQRTHSPSPRLIAAADERPADYPPDLPHVPRRAVEYRESALERSLWWHGIEQPFDLVQQLIGASAGAGWTRDRAAAAPPRSVRFIRGSMERRIDVVQTGPFSSVVLKQRGTS